jgi:hypothetical protein
MHGTANACGAQFRDLESLEIDHNNPTLSLLENFSMGTNMSPRSSLIVRFPNRMYIFVKV